MRLPSARRALRKVRALITDRRGAAAVEFAMTAPILFVIIGASLQFAHLFYVRSVLTSVVNAAGRNSALQSAATSQTAIDTRVSTVIHEIAPKATLTFTRRNYADFSKIGVPEDFTDTNGNGVYDPKECFVDMNGNGQWDDDMGKTGQGGADDVVAYTVSVTYPALFGFTHAFGYPLSQTINATTILKNQPYATQSTRTGVQVCP
ncbi:TadE/TadG family type IV pilus assembly protein [Novosphingobium sp. FKTRR1]|uniref:TadE/TadG family type IV pilus assembly protein n=1 Tax=Novosphingobium sp. FKTRR1 TaxID=2879118 RepID=UPI001CF01384|nr:TadE family protein [Novosphingobium sp. FKTRR1]